MPESNKIKELLNKYYEKLNNKEDFSFLLSDDFLLTGTVNKETKGKIDYINNNFFKGVRNLAIKKMIIDEDSAFVLVNYELISPKGNKFNADVAEMWSIKNNKLDSIAIYFDTAYFQKEMS